MVKDDVDSERGNQLPPQGLLFPISSKGSSRQDNIYHCQGGREMFYLTMHSTNFIYGYMVSDIW